MTMQQFALLPDHYHQVSSAADDLYAFLAQAAAACSDMQACVSSYHMQAEKGINIGERPMWAEKGGLDFDGRARWDAWTAAKDIKAEQAKLQFVRVSIQTKLCMPCIWHALNMRLACKIAQRTIRHILGDVVDHQVSPFPN